MNVRFRPMIFAAVVCGTPCAIFLAAARAESPVAPRKSPAASALQEVERQRAVFGSPLSGSLFGADAGDAEQNAAFAEAYQRIAEDRRGEASPMLVAPEFSPPLDPRGRYIAALREAARVLEASAADLEDCNAFGEADDLRARAQQLRLHARGQSGPTVSEKTQK